MNQRKQNCEGKESLESLKIIQILTGLGDGGGVSNAAMAIDNMLKQKGYDAVIYNQRLTTQSVSDPLFSGDNIVIYHLALTVDGICENCVIEAGKDIVLRSGVLGGNKTSIRAGGNIHAKFFEYCKVKADGFIEVTYALDSHMISFDHIYVTGKKGS